jgi:hypothetical protein
LPKGSRVEAAISTPAVKNAKYAPSTTATP